jgi:hypothetical protein
MTEAAYHAWTNGDPLRAGKLLYEALPQTTRPRWAASALTYCLPLIAPHPELDHLLAMTRDPAQWPTAPDSFNRLRQTTLTLEANPSANPYELGILYLAETVAKVTYNATNGAAPYDHHAGWRLVKHLRHIADLVNNATFTAGTWAFISAGVPDEPSRAVDALLHESGLTPRAADSPGSG